MGSSFALRFTLNSATADKPLGASTRKHFDDAGGRMVKFSIDPEGNDETIVSYYQGLNILARELWTDDPGRK